MKNIIHLITSLEGGGTENFLSQILMSSPSDWTHEVLYLKKDGVIGTRLRQAGLTVRPAGSFPALCSKLRKDRPNLLHTCLYSAHILGRWAGKLASVPVVTSQRSIDIWQKPWQRWLDSRTLSLSAAVIANSRAAAELIRSRAVGRQAPQVFEILNGIDPLRFKNLDRPAARRRYGLPDTAKVGGTLMRLHSEKGTDFIPAFAERLLPIIPDLHLLIGGVGPLEKAVKQSLAGTAYETRIHWAGWEDDAPRFLSACDFFWSLSREESYPQTLVESSAAGLPWVAPDIGGIPQLIAEGAIGRSFERLDMDRAAACVTETLKSLSTLQEKAKTMAARFQESHSISSMVASVYDVFGRIAR